LAAEAVSDAAGGVAPAVATVNAAGLTLPEPYMPGSDDKRETGRATLPEVSGAILAEWAGSRNLSVTRLRPGYDKEEVDAFLEAIHDSFLGAREPLLTPDEVRNKQFSTTRLRPGYDEEEVDSFLDEAELRLAGLRRRDAPAGREFVAAAAAGDGAVRTVLPMVAVSPGVPTAPEPYVPGRDDKVPAPIRRVRRGYWYLSWGAVFGGWALVMAAGYCYDLYQSFDLRYLYAGFLRYLYAGLALWVCAAILFGLAVRFSRLVRRASDAGSATVVASRHGGRTLVLDAPHDGYPSRLKVRRAWWAGPEMLMPGETVTLYGRPSGVGRVLVSSPARGSAFVGRGKRQAGPSASDVSRRDAPHQLSGQRSWRRYLRWGPPVLASLGFVVAVAATVITAVPPLTGYATEGDLRAGDCLTGPNLGLNTSNSWPLMVETTPCTGPHLAEVFFSRNAWPQSMAYPGDSAVDSQADASCSAAFSTYDGIDSSESAFTFLSISPFPHWDWASGDRQLVCLAYQPSGWVDYSIKGSGK
jgi:DivIVA domain-containing protein